MSDHAVRSPACLATSNTVFVRRYWCGSTAVHVFGSTGSAARFSNETGFGVSFRMADVSAPFAARVCASVFAGSAASAEESMPWPASRVIGFCESSAASVKETSAPLAVVLQPVVPAGSRAWLKVSS